MAVYAMPTTGHTNVECETEIFAEVDRMKNELMPVAELEKIKARAKASFIGQLNSNQGLALQLSEYQTRWGDWREMFRELNRINDVTVEDIQQVANKYLIRTNRVVASIETIEG